MRRRKAWCGRLVDLPSCVVRMILRLSVAPSLTEDERGLSGVSLRLCEQLFPDAVVNVLLLQPAPYATTFALNADAGVGECPRRGGEGNLRGQQ